MGIYIKNGNVEVRAPLRCPKSEIDKFVTSKEKWIRNKLAGSEVKTQLKESFAVNYGGEIYLRGKKYPIKAKAGKLSGFDGESFYMPDSLNAGNIKDICIKIYRQYAKAHIIKRVNLYANQMGTYPIAVKINSAKTRWGSCSNKKSINFTWRLIMADDDVIDYVVVHELAHLTEMNHSQRFWAVVEKELPNYKECRVKLKELQKRLATEDWD